MEAFHFLSCHKIKMTIMTEYFRIRDDVITIFFNFTRLLPILYSYHVSALSDLNQKKSFEKFAFLIMFLDKHSHINWLP